MGNEKHTIQDLAAALSANNKLSRAKNEAFARAMFTLIRSELEKDGFVKVKGLGTFKIITVNSRESIDVNTGERIEISEHQRLSFVPDKLLKERVNRPFEAFETTIIEDDPADVTKASESTDSLAIGEITSSKEMPQTNAKETSKGTEEVTEMQIETLLLDGNNTNVTRDIKMDSREEKVSAKPSSSDEIIEENQPVSLPNDVGDDSEKDSLPLSFTETPEQELEEGNEDETIKRGWLWKTIASLAVVLLCIGSYMAGYNRLIDFNRDDDAKVVCDMIPLIPADTVTNDSTAVSSDNIDVPVTDDSVQSSPLLEKSKDYEQMPDGEYLIIGELGEHEFRVGDSLLKLAIQKYGNKSFVDYIIFYNQIKNPDIIPLGAIIRLPKLVDKAGNEIKK